MLSEELQLIQYFQNIITPHFGQTLPTTNFSEKFVYYIFESLLTHKKNNQTGRLMNIPFNYNLPVDVILYLKVFLLFIMLL